MRRTAALAGFLLASLALAGCIGSGPGAGPSGGEGPADGEARADGLVLRLDRDRGTIAPGETVHVNASVANEGESDVAYREGCRHEWSVDVLDPDGEPVNWSRPMATCEGFSWERLEAGESLPFPHYSGAEPFPWNGTVWDADRDRWREVEPGTYAVEIAFEYNPDGEDSGDLERLAAQVDVTVEDDA